MADKEMSFIDHLEELRWHLIRAFASIFVFAVIAFVNKSFFFHDIILGPSRANFITYRWFCELSEVTCISKLNFILQSRLLTGQFTMHLAYSFAIGLIFAFPYAFWEIWRFVSPGLYDNERSASRGATFFVSILFCTGILFGYFIVAPLSINFLANYQLDPSISNEIDVVSYVSTLAMLVLACGIMFELPVLAYFLSSAGLITPRLMRTFRRHSIVVILIISAVITPPDVISQCLVAMPLMALYEVSIWISAMVWRRREKALVVAGEDQKIEA